MAASMSSQHDEDLKLARVLQQQEQAFHAMLMASIALPSAASDHQRSGSPVQQPSTNGSSEGEEGGHLTDEELARRLQEEEGSFGQEAQEGSVEFEFEGAAQDEDYEQMSYEDFIVLADVAGVVSKGVSLDVLHKLPRITAGQQQQQHGAGSLAAADGTGPIAANTMCVVCQCDFEASDELTLLPCNHAYHHGCLAAWLADNKVCPICHKEVHVPEHGGRHQSATPAAAAVDDGSSAQAA